MTRQPFGVYVHVPFCAKRCGYCDFNTYTPSELAAGDQHAQYVRAVRGEFELAERAVDAELVAGGVDTVFFGGGTPTMLSDAQLGDLVGMVRSTWGLAPGAEVTVEANPDTVTPGRAAAWADAGVTRVSVGMQSTVPRVLQILDRTHDRGAVATAVSAVHDAGLQASVDLIYGTPGESVAEWRASVEAALALGPEHVSAYSLTIEQGTAMGRQLRRGEVPPTDPDDQAAKYEAVDDMLGAAGYGWYEISNWARTDAHRCRHNVGYWGGGQWWGFGPGAHSYLAGRRWWNVAHPGRYAEAVEAGSAEAGSEFPGDEARQLERVMLGIRLREGLAINDVPDGDAVAALVAEGLVEETARRVVLTRRGRLLADLVTHRLVGA